MGCRPDRYQEPLHATLTERLIPLPRIGATDLFGTTGRAWLEEQLPHLNQDGQAMLRSDLRQLDAVNAELAQMDGRLAQIGYAREDVKLLMTLPGVSLQVAMGLVAAWGTIALPHGGESRRLFGTGAHDQAIGA